MSRYIDADALKTNINTAFWSEIEKVIDNAPSIDIVRCKECKHREEYPCKVYHNDDWFCADGEREGE